MKTDLTHRGEVAIGTLMRAWLKGRLWHTGTKAGRMPDSMGGCAVWCDVTEDYNRLEEYKAVIDAFEGDRYNDGLPPSLAEFDDVLRTADCIMSLDPEYFDPRPLRIREDALVLEEMNPR